MSDQLQETQDVQQDSRIPLTPAPPPGFYTAFEMELAVRMGKLEAGVTKIKEDVIGIVTKIERGFSNFTAELSNQKSELVGQKVEMARIKTELAGQKAEMAGMKTEIADQKAEMAGIKTEMAGMKTEMAGMKTEMAGIKTELAGQKAEMDGIKN
ncbi:MAG: hypothetical protein LBR80_05435 [Deltaproteobacteria bacterium]|jgi:chromosome segregation ATPase|nr:hypothetical protein [Deltaproteobacteria bacterium]